MSDSNRRRALLTVPLALLASGAFLVTSGTSDDIFVTQLTPLRIEPLPVLGRAAAQGPSEPGEVKPDPETAAPTPVVIAAPAPVRPGHGGAIAELEDDGSDLKAIAYQYMAPVYERASLRSLITGRVRRSTVFSSPSLVGGSCGNGTWYRIAAGYVCTGDGFHVRHKRNLPDLDQKLPALERNLPYGYAQVISPRAPRFYRIPTLDELTQIEHAEVVGDPLPNLEVVDRYMRGDYFVAIDRREETPIGPFVRTVRGRYVREADLQMAEPSTMRGEVLDEGSLPMAFVPGAGEVPVYRLGDAGAVEVGHAERYARVHVADTKTVDGVGYAVTDEGLALRLDDVRLAEPVARPGTVPDGGRWVHVDLGRQVLVAYEGDRPRYATLVASGKPGWDTPTGLHRIVSKLATITMSGDDPREGYYEVEDVPWTMYYDGSYALHGAYWHDAFGNTRSHGCTNLAPADARWLYGFTSPEVPEGWQGRLHARGSWVYLTRDGTL